MTSNLVRELNYPTSRDYAYLWAIAQQTSIVCIVDWRSPLSPGAVCRDVAMTLTVLGPLGSVSVCARGINYFWADSEAEFVKACKSFNLEWIPHETNEIT